MKTLKILPILATVAISALLPSCNTDEEKDYVTTQSVPSCVNIFANGTSTPSIVKGVSYRLDLNYTKSTADLYVYGLKMPDGSQYPELLFEGVPWSVSGSWKTIRLMGAVPTSPSAMANLPLFTSLNFSLVDRVVEQSYFPCFKIEYEFNGRSVVSTTTAMLCDGSTTLEVTEGTDANTSTTNEPYYLMQYDTDKGTISVRAYNVRPIPLSDACIFEVRDVPCTISDSGVFTFESSQPVSAYTASSLTSSLVLNNNLKVTKISGNCTASNDFKLDIEYECPQAVLATYGTVTASGSAPKF